MLIFKPYNSKYADYYWFNMCGANNKVITTSEMYGSRGNVNRAIRGVVKHFKKGHYKVAKWETRT